MRSFDSIWKTLAEEQPVLNNPEATVAIKVSELKAGTKLVYETAYTAGKVAGLNEAKNVAYGLAQQESENDPGLTDPDFD